MTVIQKIKMHGFKSFAKSTEIPFGKNFSMILGPNGAGKSNISDSICFVLGKSSSKALRAERASHLIYNGGKKGSPSKSAQVDVFFDNSSKEFPIAEKAIKISRLVRQNGQSTYKINDKTRTRQQILDLLSTAKIEPDGHNVILQGDIIRFTDMKAEHRREIIEEIAGISVYEEKKGKALRELEKIQEKLKEAEIIMTERNTHLKELKRDRDQAIQYKELETNIKRNKATYLHSQIKTKQQNKEEVENRIKKQEEEKSKIQTKINELKEEINNNKANVNKINKEVEERGEKQQLNLHKQVEDLKTSIIKKDSRIDALKNEINRINNRKKQLINNISDLNQNIANLEKQLANINKEQTKLKGEETKTSSEINKFKEKHKIVGLGDLDSELEKSQTLLFKQNEEKQNLLREKDKLLFQLDDIETKISSNKGSGDVKKLKQGFKDATLKLNKELNESAVISLRLNTLRRDLVKLNEDVAKLNVQNITVKERSFADVSIKRILSSDINGIYNTISGLGGVDQKYNLSLEVAAGARVRSIVVQDDLVAEKCINYLKKNKLGIATFLPLNKIRPRLIPENIQRLMGKKGVHNLAINLIKFDPKFRNAFSYVFGPTLIVDNLDIAREIGIGRARMVTLDGNLIEQSGAIVGGFRRRSGVAFKEKDFSGKLKRLEEEKLKLEQQIKSIEQKKEINDSSILGLRKKKANLEADIIKLEKTLGIFDFDKLNKDKIELNNKLKEINNKVKELEKEIVSKNKLIEEIRSKKETTKASSYKELTDLENKKESTREKLIHLNSEIKGINTQINSLLKPEIERTNQIINAHNKELADFNKELTQLSSEVKQNRVNLKEKERKEKQFYNEFRSLFNKRNKINELIQKKETALVREEERIRSFESKINNISLDKARLIAEMAGLEKEFEDFKEEKLRKGINLEDLRVEIRRLEQDFNKLGNVNLRALEVYEQLQEEFKNLVEKIGKLKIEREDVFGMINEIEFKKQDLFMKTFDDLQKNFKTIFSMLSDKGQAFLDLENKEKPLEAGLDIKVKISSNKYLDIKSLSGGEKTLTALAFIFAIQEFQPASFYLLDEVDAALDKENSNKLSNLISQYSKKAQYIVISHNDAIISEADQIYGVSMKDGVSKVLSLKI